MVLQKRLDYGFNGYQVPVMPRASRSVRRRRLFKKKVEDTQMYAFDLLATVAGELLLEKNKESKPSSSNVSVGRDQFPIRKDSIKQEEWEEERPFKQEPCDQGSCDDSASFFRIGSQRHGPDHATKQCSHTEDSTLVLASVITKCETPEGITCAESTIGESRKEYEKFPRTIHEKCHTKRGFLGCAELHDRAKDELERQQKVEQRTGSIINGMVPDMFSLEDPVHMDAKPPALVSSDSSVDVPFSGTHNPCSSFTRCRDDAKVVSRDDDDNSSGCTQHVTPTLKSFRPPCYGDWRIRKLLASKYWKATPKILKHGERSNSEMFPKPLFRSRKACYTRQRTQRYSFKRRKLFERTSVSPTSDGKISGISVKATDLASRVPFPVIAHKSSLEARDSHVKLRIKSIRVPELLIEIPETATIGSLKRMVVEAVTTVLGGGLRVGVLLQGKKIRDDNKTLLQFGISHDDKLDGLGFSLEPTTPVPPSVLPCPEDSYCLLPCDSNQPLSSCPPIPISDAVVTEAASNGPGPPLVDSGCYSERGQDSVPSPDMSLEKTTPDSKALVAIPSMNVEALAVVPLDKKSKRSELVQRRIRRPFSVSEVEALVQAVEKLGTGRWRDVKLCAFENAKHRTYVDLKDKWKTLVHTARISPQQRRGEPVPQELLDRVLSAHGYWSQQQKKQQQIKPPLPH